MVELELMTKYVYCNVLMIGYFLGGGYPEELKFQHFFEDLILFNKFNTKF